MGISSVVKTIWRLLGIRKLFESLRMERGRLEEGSSGASAEPQIRMLRVPQAILLTMVLRPTGNHHRERPMV